MSFGHFREFPSLSGLTMYKLLYCVIFPAVAIIFIGASCELGASQPEVSPSPLGTPVSTPAVSTPHIALSVDIWEVYDEGGTHERYCAYTDLYQEFACVRRVDNNYGIETMRWDAQFSWGKLDIQAITPRSYWENLEDAKRYVEDRLAYGPDAVLDLSGIVPTPTPNPSLYFTEMRPYGNNEWWYYADVPGNNVSWHRTEEKVGTITYLSEDRYHVLYHYSSPSLGHDAHAVIISESFRDAEAWLLSAIERGPEWARNYAKRHGRICEGPYFAQCSVKSYRSLPPTPTTPMAATPLTIN